MSARVNTLSSAESPSTNLIDQFSMPPPRAARAEEAPRAASAPLRRLRTRTSVAKSQWSSLAKHMWGHSLPVAPAPLEASAAGPESEDRSSSVYTEPPETKPWRRTSAVAIQALPRRRESDQSATPERGVTPTPVSPPRRKPSMSKHVLLLSQARAASEERAKAAAANIFSHLFKTKEMPEIAFPYADLTDESIDFLAEYLEDEELSAKIKTVDIRGNQLTAERIGRLSLAIGNHPFIISLNVAHNLLAVSGLRLLVEALVDDGANRVQKLDLSNNRISREGVAVIAELLDGQTALATLVLADNPIGEAGVTEFIKMMRSDNTSLSEVGLYLTGATSLQEAEVRYLLERNKEDRSQATRVLMLHGEISIRQKTTVAEKMGLGSSILKKQSMVGPRPSLGGKHAPDKTDEAVLLMRLALMAKDAMDEERDFLNDLVKYITNRHDERLEHEHKVEEIDTRIANEVKNQEDMEDYRTTMLEELEGELFAARESIEEVRSDQREWVLDLQRQYDGGATELRALCAAREGSERLAAKLQAEIAVVRDAIPRLRAEREAIRKEFAKVGKEAVDLNRALFHLQDHDEMLENTYALGRRGSESFQQFTVGLATMLDRDVVSQAVTVVSRWWRKRQRRERLKSVLLLEDTAIPDADLTI